MKKAVVMGCSCVIISDLTPEELDSFKKYMPEALTLVDPDSPDSSFSLDIDDGPGHIADTTAAYSRAKSADGKATITVILDPEADDKLDLVQGTIGPSLLKLDALEKKLLDQREQLAETVNTMKALIDQM